MSPQVPAEPQDQATDSLLAEFGTTFDSLLKNRVDAEVIPEKNWQYLRLQKCDLYNRGLQFNALTVNGGSLDWQSIGTPGNPAGNAGAGEGNRGLLDYNFDIVTAYRRKYQAVLGLRPFYNAKAVPNDPESEIDRKAAKQANLVAQWARPIWKARTKNIELFSRQWRAGTVYGHIAYVADKSLFGEIEEPKFAEKMVTLEPEGYRCPTCKFKTSTPTKNDGLNGEGEAVEGIACPQCGAPLSDLNFEEAQTLPVPEQQGMVKYPGSGPALNFWDGYYVTVPFDAPADTNKLPYLHFEKEENQAVLLQMFGENLRKKMQDVASSDSMLTQQGAITRASAYSLVGTPRSMMTNRWTWGRTWLTPVMFQYIEDKAKRDLAFKNFPDGLLIHRVNELTVKLESSVLADEWVSFIPEPAETMYHDPICWDILGHQDMKNDIGNIGMALLERGLPAFAVDPDVFNAEALNSKPYSPFEVIEAKPGVGARLDTAIKMLPAATFPEHMMPFSDTVDANAQSVLGLLPAVWGGGERQPTAEGQRTVLNQALMQLGVPGEYAQMGWADCYFKACKQIEKYAPKAFRVATSDTTAEVVDPEVMRAGNYHFEAEPGIPMSWAEKRDQLNQIISQNPDLAHGLFLDAPLNAGAMKNYLLSDMPEIHSPEDDARNYTLGQIQQLIADGQQPIMDPQGGMQPSLPPDDFIDPGIYALVAKIAQEWLISPHGLKVRDSNPMGYKNVFAWAMANNQKASPPAPPAPPPPPPRISVSLNGDAAQQMGLTPAIQQEFGQPQQGPPPGPQPSGPPPQGPQGGPPPPTNGGDQMVPQAGGNPVPPGPVPVGPMNVQPQQLPIQ